MGRGRRDQDGKLKSARLNYNTPLRIFYALTQEGSMTQRLMQIVH